MDLAKGDKPEVSAVGLDAETRSNVPELNSVVFGSGDDEISVGIEDDVRHRSAVSDKLFH